MNNLRDPFSLRPTTSPFAILRQPLQAQFQQKIESTQQSLQTFSTEVVKTAKATQAAVESAVVETLDDMSFQVPKNLPSFTSSQRDVENKVWGAAFGKNTDLPLYKDKPYYSSSSSQARRAGPRRRKRVMGLLALVVLLGLWWFDIFDLGETANQYKDKLRGGGGDEEIVGWDKRRDKVRDVFKESWAAYERDAWGFDEYHPVSKSGKQMIPKGLGWIIVDSLDTLMIMNLTTELSHAREWVEHSLTFEQNSEVNTFETTIRMLGGLLSAHYLQEDLHIVPSHSSNPKEPDDMYLNKATDLANRLLGAYESPSGIPWASFNLKTSEGVPSHTDGGSSSTAEAATLQLEMKYIAHLTGETLFWEKASNVMSVLDSNAPEAGLVPIFISAKTGKFTTNEIRLGSRGDSYYEYLIKQYLQTAKTEPIYNTMYTESVAGIKKHLITTSHPSHLTVLGELPTGIGGQPLYPKMDHLVCFVPGMLALGATHGIPVERARKMTSGALWDKLQEDDLHLARELMHTCYEMYNVTATGLAPEIAFFDTDHPPPTDGTHVMEPARDIQIKPRDAHNLQRPETVESLFIMWRLTGDEIYREWGWKIFQAFVKHTKVPGDGNGYTSLESVLENPPHQRDNMESFWLAETLKYFYLLFSDEIILPLDEVVFNTEAHPLPIFHPSERFPTGWARKQPAAAAAAADPEVKKEPVAAANPEVVKKAVDPLEEAPDVANPKKKTYEAAKEE